MGQKPQKALRGRGVLLVMQPRNNADVPLHSQIIDGATLYLCRQGQRWVVVIESARVTGAVPFHHAGGDNLGARFELLTLARLACPDATVMSTDGALTSADYEWRVEVRGIAARPGDLGVALQRELTTGSADERDAPKRPVIGRGCHWGQSPSFSGRPRTF
ncbi:MAG TPA: hypothetical protein VIJ56_00830 [Acidimicrobiales bacterium]